MAKIFISYRRDDSAAAAGRICDHLHAHFGPDAVFRDIDNIPFGVDFREHIDAAVSQCDVVLVVIGRHWAGGTDDRRRIDDPRDFVRIEIESALKRDIPVIPILIDRTTMPSEADVPSSLAGLTYRNALDVDQGRDFRTHVDRLVAGIEFHFEQAKTNAARPSSQPQQSSSKRPVANDPEQLRKISPAEAHQPAKPTPKVEPRPGRPSSISHPSRQSSVEVKRGADGLNPKPSLGPAEAIDSEPLPKQTAVSPGHQVRAASTQLKSAPRAHRNNRWFWLYVAAIPLLALGIIIYIVTKPPASELAERREERTSSPTEAIKMKSASSTSAVKSPRVARPQLGREWTNTIGMKLVRIEPGEFLMGTTREQVDRLMQLFPNSKRENFDNEQPQHPVKISRPFYLGIHEVTVGQFKRFVESTSYQTEAEKDGKGSFVRNHAAKGWRLDPSVNWRNPSFSQTDDHPVLCVSRNDALAFCEWLGQQESRTYRLPTEAEWEFACRAGATTLYPETDDPESLVNVANVADATLKRKFPAHDCIKGDDGYLYTAPVGSLAPNRWGFYDMIGNVTEWCADWYDEKYYASSPLADPPGGTNASHSVVRGGNWYYEPRHCRPAERYKHAPKDRGYNLGFRVAAGQE